MIGHIPFDAWLAARRADVSRLGISAGHPRPIYAVSPAQPCRADIHAAGPNLAALSLDDPEGRN